MSKTEKENLKKEKEDPKKHQRSGPVMTAGLAEPLPLPTPLPTESTAAAEQTEEELAEEQRNIRCRKRAAEMGWSAVEHGGCVKIYEKRTGLEINPDTEQYETRTSTYIERMKRHQIKQSTAAAEQTIEV